MLRDAYGLQRYQLYRDDAMAHLRKNFAPTMRAIQPEQALTFIDAAYDIGKRRGMRSGREHLHHLNICMFWGIHFHGDPQYWDQLRRAGWDPATQIPRFDPNALRIQIKRRNNCLNADFDDPHRIIAAFAALYDQPDTAWNDRSDLPFISHAFPSQFAMVPQQDWITMAETVRRRCLVYGLKKADLTACVGLAVILGAGFLDDPRFEWAALALKQPILQDKRLELGVGVQRYWDALTSVGQTEEQQV